MFLTLDTSMVYLIYHKKIGYTTVKRGRSAMPTWGEVQNELINMQMQNPLDIVRKKYLGFMHQYTGRNIITYYSAFLQKPTLEGVEINDNDKNAFMQVVYGLNRQLGLDLILHTPGGDLAAAESLVNYLKSMFGNDIRVFVPQIAMSAGTMIALSAKEIVMGKQSNLGPIDPQFGGISCAGILEEFNEALKSVNEDPHSAEIWSLIISKYHPTFIGDCRKAQQWAETTVKKWMLDNMFLEGASNRAMVDKIVSELSSHDATYSHSRHIHKGELKQMGLKIVDLEGLDNTSIGNCKDLQDCVLTIHHAYMHTLGNTRALKIVENHHSDAMIMNANPN